MGGRRRHEMGLAPSAIRALERLRQCSIFAMTQHRIVLSRWGTLNQAFCTSSGWQIWAARMPDQPITEAHADSRPGQGAGGPVVHMARCLRQRTGPAQDVLCGGRRPAHHANAASRAGWLRRVYIMPAAYDGGPRSECLARTTASSRRHASAPLARATGHAYGMRRLARLSTRPAWYRVLGERELIVMSMAASRRAVVVWSAVAWDGSARPRFPQHSCSSGHRHGGIFFNRASRAGDLQPFAPAVPLEVGPATSRSWRQPFMYTIHVSRNTGEPRRVSHSSDRPPQTVTRAENEAFHAL